MPDRGGCTGAGGGASWFAWTTQGQPASDRRGPRGRLVIVATQEDHARSVPSFLDTIAAVCPDFAEYHPREYAMVQAASDCDAMVRVDFMLQFAAQLRPFHVRALNPAGTCEQSIVRAVLIEAVLSASRAKPGDLTIVVSSSDTVRREVAALQDRFLSGAILVVDPHRNVKGDRDTPDPSECPDTEPSL